MQIKISAHNTKMTKAMKEYAEKKYGKLEQYFNNIQKIEVLLDVRKIDDSNRRDVAEVTLWAAGKKVIRATEGGQDMYAAIDMVYEEIVRQLRKHKDKHVKEKRREAEKIKEKRRAAPMDQVSKPGLSIVPVQSFADKPMTDDEAKDEIKVLKKDFLLFENPESGSFNLAFKKGRDIEILTPESSDLKLYTPVEAVYEIERAGSNFVMFKNKETKSVSVIYRRRMGNYGLIEPSL